MTDKKTLCILFMISGWTQTAALASPRPDDLAQASFEDILKYYQFVGDLRQHPSERDISDEYFWRYPFPLPAVRFKIMHDMGDLPEELPPVSGASRAVQHMNYGRVLFTKKDYEEARKVWLAARARYGVNFPFHRRNDYFISLSYLKISQDILKSFSYDMERSEVRLTYSNTATFLSWAFIKKLHLPDEDLDRLAPKSLYNLAAIYYNFDRYNGAHGAAETGLNFLRKTGRKEFRPEFRRIIAETWIRDSQYLKALQEIDTMIRQDPDPEMAARGFARAGDIFFDLNNYELAEEAYRISQAVDFKVNRLLPLSFLLRGESLFWMGNFSEAQKSLRFALDSISHKNASAGMSLLFRSFGALRIADSWLARLREALRKKDNQEAMQLRSKAELSYYQVQHEFPRTEAATIASVRLACLNLPVYLGQNIRHAREALKNVFNGTLPSNIKELAGSCEVLSYGEKEKNQEFVDKVKVFYEMFPRSRFLPKFFGPLVRVRQRHLKEYLDASDDHKAVLYFEANRKTLFPDPDLLTRQRLFMAYMRMKSADKASEFYPDFQNMKDKTNLQKVYEAVFLAEIEELKGKPFNPGRQQKIRDEFLRSGITFAQSPELQNLLHRILQTGSFEVHLDWMLRVSAAWSLGASRFICDSVYPLLSRKVKISDTVEKRALLWKEVTALTEKLFPALFNQSLTCSQALLDLERDLGNREPYRKDYCDLWLSRFQWPQKKITVPLIWLAAETCAKRNEAREVSDKLLNFLVSQKSEEFPEVLFARSRLDRKKTEVEKLWDQDLK